MKILIALLLLLCSTASKAEEAEGYIIAKGGDTVRGHIDVRVGKRSLLAKDQQILFPYMETAIKFSDKDSKKKKYDYDDVLGFGFLYNGQWYHFTVLDMKKDKVDKGNPLIDESLFSKFFVHRYEEGYLTLYKQYFLNDGGLYRERIYVKHPQLGYIRMVPESRAQGFREMLAKRLKMEELFIHSLDPQAKFYDIEAVLSAYNKWKLTN